MKKTEIISCSAFVLMIILLVIAFTINDPITSTLLASFGIIAGAFTSHQYSTSKKP